MSDDRPVSTGEWRRFLASRLGGWTGREPASEAAVRAAEERLGLALPPSYRSFLLTSNGGDAEETPIDDLSPLYGLFPADEVVRLTDSAFADLAKGWADDETVLAVLTHAVLVGWGDDGGYWLLDPTTIEAGEWSASYWFPGDGEDLDPQPGFAAAVASALAD